MPSPGAAPSPGRGPRLPGESAPQTQLLYGPPHTLCSTLQTPRWLLAHHSLPHQSHLHSCRCHHTGARSTSRRDRSYNGRVGLEGTQTGLQETEPESAPGVAAGPGARWVLLWEPAPPARGASPHSSGFSSELSPQSSSPSHFHARGLHRVLLHWNSSRGQVRTGCQGRQRAKSEH